jgi:hypothetical protein
MFGRVTENVVKEPDVTLIPEHIQTVDNAEHFKTMSLHQQARETHITIQPLRTLYYENQRRAKKLNKYVIGHEEEITINLR